VVDAVVVPGGPQVAGEHVAGLVEHLAHRGEGLGEAAAHARRLAALAREQQRRRPLGRHRAAGLDVVAHGGGAEPARVAVREGRVGRRAIARGRRERGPERGRRGRRQAQERGPGPGLRRGHRGGGDGRQHEVHVGARQAEPAHADQARRPRAALGRDHVAALREVQGRRGSAQVQRRRPLAVREAAQDLRERRHAGRDLEVAEVRLHGAQLQRPVRRPVAEHPVQRVHLDGVPERRAGAVGLDGVDVVGGAARVRERPPDHVLLGGARRRGEAGGGAVVADRRAHEPRQGAGRVGPALQHEQAGALAAGVAVGVGVERPAPARRRRGVQAREHAGVFGRQHQVHRARERHVGLAVEERAPREVHRYQRRRTRRVQREVRAGEPQRVRDPAARERGQVAGARVRIGVAGLSGPLEPVEVPRVARAHEHGHAAPGEVGAAQARALQRLHREREQQPVLRVHRGGLAGRHAERLGVEALDLVPREPGGVAAGELGVPRVGPALGRRRAEHVAAGGQELVEAVEVADVTGEPQRGGGEHHLAGGGHRRERRRGHGLRERGGEAAGGGVVEQQRGRHVEAAGDGHDAERVQAGLEEPAVVVGGLAEHGGERVADGPTGVDREARGGPSHSARPRRRARAAPTAPTSASRRRA
jgi:hypothetical protein